MRMIKAISVSKHDHQLIFSVITPIVLNDIILSLLKVPPRSIKVGSRPGGPFSI